MKLRKKSELGKSWKVKWINNNVHFFPLFVWQHIKNKNTTTTKSEKKEQKFISKGALFLNFVSHLFSSVHNFLVRLHIIFRSFDDAHVLKLLTEHHYCTWELDILVFFLFMFAIFIFTFQFWLAKFVKSTP